MTNYEPYGARHFLRKLDPEGASELRRRFDYLRDGKTLDKGASADIDRFRLDQVLVYRTLVLRRGPAASRPPSAYRLVWSGRYYEVWQRPVHPARRIVEHLSLGDATQAAAVPPCARVRLLRGSTRWSRRPGRRSIGLGARRSRARAAAGERPGRRRLHRLARRRLVRAPRSRSTGTRSARSAWS